jgi:hypothetical protein
MRRSPVSSWIVLSKTIVIWPSKIAQLEARIEAENRAEILA